MAEQKPIYIFRERQSALNSQGKTIFEYALLSTLLTLVLIGGVNKVGHNAMSSYWRITTGFDDALEKAWDEVPENINSHNCGPGVNRPGGGGTKHTDCSD